MIEAKRYKLVWDGELYSDTLFRDFPDRNEFDVVLYEDYAALTAERDRLREALVNADRVAKQLGESTRNPFGHDSHHFMALAQSVERFTSAALAGEEKP